MLGRVQQLLVEAMRHPDPSGYLRLAVADDAQLTAAEREWLLAADADGLSLSRMLVRKLRLQRLLRGDATAVADMAADPAAFARRFAAYDAQVEPQAVFPSDEAEAFRGFG